MPTFKGKYDSQDAHAWLGEIEKIFQVIACTKEHKVLFGTQMLSEEAEAWWDNARQRLEVVGTKITWVMFIVHSRELLS